MTRLLVCLANEMEKTGKFCGRRIHALPENLAVPDIPCLFSVVAQAKPADRVPLLSQSEWNLPKSTVEVIDEIFVHVLPLCEDKDAHNPAETLFDSCLLLRIKIPVREGNPCRGSPLF